MKGVQKTKEQKAKEARERRAKKSQERFIESAKRVHGDKYDYSLAMYRGSHQLVTIICKNHGAFQQKPVNHINRKCGCKVCYYARITEAKGNARPRFVKAANRKHKNRYDYSGVIYISKHINVLVRCPEHGGFAIPPSFHLSGMGCPSCHQEDQEEKDEEKFWFQRKSHNALQKMEENVGILEKLSLEKQEEEAREIEKKRVLSEKMKEKFIAKCSKIYNSLYDYSLVVYKSLDEKVLIGCPLHGHFHQKARNHLRGKGCFDCSFPWYTPLSERTVQVISSYGISLSPSSKCLVIPLENGKSKTIKFEGYCEQTKTLYKFCPCLWNGCTLCYADRDFVNPANNKTMDHCYQKFLATKKLVEEKGYSIVVIWECALKFYDV